MHSKAPRQRPVTLDDLRQIVAQADADAQTPALTVQGLCEAYLEAEAPRLKGTHGENIRRLLDRLAAEFGTLPAAGFRPSMLRAFRADLAKGKKCRRPWCRSTANRAGRRVIAVFRWAVAHELLPAAPMHALATLEPLRCGEARERPPVKPVPDNVLRAILAEMRPELRDLVTVQTLTGMRSGELLTMRGRNLDRSGPIWRYIPDHHKTEHHGRERVIAIGPKAQAIMAPYLGRSPDSVIWRNITREAWTVNSYMLAVRRACDRAERVAQVAAGGLITICPRCGRNFSTPNFLLDHVRFSHPRIKLPNPDKRIIPRVHPHRFRHNAATAIAAELGLDVARAALGHSDTAVTRVYADTDGQLAERAAAAIG